MEYNGAELFEIPYGIQNTKINLLSNNEKLKSQDFSPNGKYGVEIANGGPMRLLPGNVKGGQLTRVGFEQAYHLGQGLFCWFLLSNWPKQTRKSGTFLREKYDIKDLNEVYCRSTAFQRTIETMQGIITGIKPNQSVDIDIADNDQEILIFQREVLDQNLEIKKIRQILHDAVAEDPVNLELVKSSNIEVKLKSRA